MKKLFLKSLINFAMIETAFLASSVGFGSTIPTANGFLMATGFSFMLANAFGGVPALATSVLFASLSKD